MASKILSKKDRRNSGRQEDINYDPINCPYYFEYWDDWNDYRDCMRSGNLGDGSKILNPKGIFYCWDENLPRRNKKNKMLLKRRKAMKTKRM